MTSRSYSRVYSRLGTACPTWSTKISSARFQLSTPFLPSSKFGSFVQRLRCVGFFESGLVSLCARYPVLGSWLGALMRRCACAVVSTVCIRTSTFLVFFDPLHLDSDSTSSYLQPITLLYLILDHLGLLCVFLTVHSCCPFLDFRASKREANTHTLQLYLVRARFLVLVYLLAGHAMLTNEGDSQTRRKILSSLRSCWASTLTTAILLLLLPL